MSNAQFISALRDYAALARARHTSYASAVHRFVELRMEAMAQAGGTPADYEEALKAIRSIAMREYGKFDATFSFDALG